MPSEKAIMNDILMGVTALEDAMFWRENVGFAWVGRDVTPAVGRTIKIRPRMKVLEDARPLQAGVPGLADIMGTRLGRAIALEVKTQTGRQEVSQIRFERAFTAAGGAYSVVRSREEALEFLRETCGG